MKSQKHSALFRKNSGMPGVVYVLENSSLKKGLYKIGQSTRSGTARANDLNRQASTGMPANYRCIFEYHTADCGRAEIAVHRRLNTYRKGKWGQEFFEVPLEKVKSIIMEECDQFHIEADTVPSRKVYDSVLRIPNRNIVHKKTTVTDNSNLNQPSSYADKDDSTLEKIGSWSLALTLVLLNVWLIKSCSR